MRGPVSKLAIASLLALITILFNWKLVLSDQYTWAEAPENSNQVLPLLQAQAAQWHTGHFPLWDPFMNAGQPIVGQVQTGTLNPLNWILFSLPFKDGFIPLAALHWYWVSIQILGVLFGYLLCRDLRLSRTASVLGGCAFGLGGFVGGIGSPQLMMSGLLLPLILMFFLRVLRGEKSLANAAASGALLGASFLSGKLDVPVYFTLAMCGLWIYDFISLGRKGWRNAVRPAVAFFACCVLLAAAQILPAYEFGKLSAQWNEKVAYGTYDDSSLYPAALLGIAIRGFEHGTAIFVGLVVLTLALLGAAARWRERMVRVLASISLGGLLFALGSRDIFYGVLYAVIPILDKARAPSMAEVIFQLGTVALAAYGLDFFRESKYRLAIRSLASMAVFLFASLIVLFVVQPQQSDGYKTLAEAAIVALLLAGILHAWNHARLSNQSAGVLLILLLLFELNNSTNSSLRPTATAAGLQRMIQDRDLADVLKRIPPPVRVEVDDKEIPYNFGDWFGVQTINGKLHAAPLFAANYYIGREPMRPDQVALFEGQRGPKLFTNPQALPYARLVHAVSAVEDPTTDLRRTAVIEGTPPALEACDGGEVTVPRYRPTSVMLLTDSPCRSMVVLADAWCPGWKATVDGKPAKLWKVYNAVRGVVVEAGQHEVVMVYRPSSVFIGAALGGLGILLCFALHYLPGKKGWRGIHFSHHLHPAPQHRPRSA
ncbi:MAG TPA: YfhO family protein [Bryobacteraceae bacterium]|nr:YfhO family protein [Bryobacteraceae bacterium]